MRHYGHRNGFVVSLPPPPTDPPRPPNGAALEVLSLLGKGPVTLGSLARSLGLRRAAANERLRKLGLLGLARTSGPAGEERLASLTVLGRQALQAVNH